VSSLRHSDTFIEIEAAVVGSVGDKHYLMTAAVGKDNKVARLGGALQADLLLWSRQLVDRLFEGEGVRVHMALHCWLISNTGSMLAVGAVVCGARLVLSDKYRVEQAGWTAYEAGGLSVFLGSGEPR
jgi:hypothetical protein